jgi:lysozyme family protein
LKLSAEAYLKMPADFTPAWDFTLRFEDDGLTGKITGDDGGRTRYGISERAHPEAWASGPPTLALASQIASNSYWTPWQLYLLDDQDIATRVFDMIFNAGEREEGKILETALVELGYLEPADVDNIIGPRTLQAANKACADGHKYELLMKIREKRRDYYDDLESAKPEDLRYAAGWARRAMA